MNREPLFIHNSTKVLNSGKCLIRYRPLALLYSKPKLELRPVITKLIASVIIAGLTQTVCYAHDTVKKSAQSLKPAANFEKAVKDIIMHGDLADIAYLSKTFRAKFDTKHNDMNKEKAGLDHINLSSRVASSADILLFMVIDIQHTQTGTVTRKARLDFTLPRDFMFTGTRLESSIGGVFHNELLIDPPGNIRFRDMTSETIHGGRIVIGYYYNKQTNFVTDGSIAQYYR